ncbi:MAG: LLM class flavin-dependent oxidoreductase [Nitrososphaerota archaeon]
MGPDVTCVIDGRYHPALIAQAAATLDNMFPGRLLLGVGSGEAVNEAPFFLDRWGRWPRWYERIKRTVEAVKLMRMLWVSQDYISFVGDFFKLENVFLYTKPKTKIPIYFSALGPKAAVFAGMYGDHLITIGTPKRCKELIFPRFAEGVNRKNGDMSQAEKMVLVNVYIGEVGDGLRKLKSGMAGTLARGSFDIADPRKIESLAPTVDDDVVLRNFAIAPTVLDLEKVVESYFEAGANHIVLGTGASPELIKEIGRELVPILR